MSLLGLSLIALISFLCYAYALSPWPLLSWLSRGTFRVSNQVNNTSTGLTGEEPQSERVNESEKKAGLDRGAMPPPVAALRRLPAGADTPLEIQNGPSSETPSKDNLVLGGVNRLSASSNSALMLNSSMAPFPAQNSIQRASGGLRPPRSISMSQRQSGLLSANFPSSSPPRSPVPNRSPAASTSSLAIPPTHHAIPPKPRKKVILLPGHSPLDWAHFSSSNDPNLRGLPPSTPYLRVSPSLLRQHTGRKGKNAWTALGGKVYNITPYMPYHPGGEVELMKAAGRDGTKIFGEVHPWINWEGMLEPCLVGIAVGDESTLQGKLEEID